MLRGGLVHSPALRQSVARTSGPEDALYLKTSREGVPTVSILSEHLIL